VRVDEAQSAYGPKAVVVLNVDGTDRAVWLTQTALVSKFQDELQRRRASDFDADERIVDR